MGQGLEISLFVFSNLGYHKTPLFVAQSKAKDFAAILDAATF